MNNDLLNMDMINALPQPLLIREFKSDTWWPLIDICVETGLHRIDVCGMIERRQLSSCAQLMDDCGLVHEIDLFFIDCEEQQGE